MASLSVGFNIELNAGCGSLTFTDTSAYGSGASGEAPNYNDVGSTKIEFVFNEGDTTRTVTITDFVPTEEEPSITLYAADLGFADVIPDQEVPSITYTIYDAEGNVLGTRTSPFLFSCNFISCFNSQVIKAANNCGCGNKDVDRLWSMWVRFLGIQASFEVNAGCAVGAMAELSAECAKLCFNNCQGDC